MKRIKLNWKSSGDNDPMASGHSTLGNLTFFVQAYREGTTLELFLDRGNRTEVHMIDREFYSNIYEAQEAAQAIVDEIIKAKK